MKSNEGVRAVNVMPSLKAGHPVAEVVLLRIDTFKDVEEKLV